MSNEEHREILGRFMLWTSRMCSDKGVSMNVAEKFLGKDANSQRYLI